MKEKKKQSAVVAVATVLTVTSVMSPVAAVYANETDTAISQQTETVQIKENAPPITLPQDLVGNEGQSLQDIVLPENWKWSDETTVISKTKTEYPARFSVDDVTYDYSNEEGYNAEGHYVERMVEITVELENSEPVKQEQVEVVQKNSRMLKENNPTTSNAGDIEINDTNFPDKIFRDWLEAQHYGQDGKITQDEIAGITVINVKISGSIGDLTGIEYFTALTALDCSYTGITSLDVSSNTALTDLECSSTMITSLDVSKNTKLTNLVCNNTRITSLDVSKNTQLTYLKCSLTGITSLDVSKNTQLTSLRCYNTGITSLDVRNNTALTDLYCDNTGITSLDVRNNTALTDLYCDNTGITSLDVSKNTQLTELDCSNTPLAYLNIGENKGLTVDKSNLINPTVYVATNSFMLTDKFSGIDITKISNLKGADWNSQTGEVYNLKSGTPITYDYDCGTSNGGKETLNVTLTVTNELAINAINFPDKAFRTWLEQQDYGPDGKITQDEIAGITEINVSWNTNIKDLTGIEHFTALTDLHCNRTGIKSLDIRTNTKLTNLYCNNTGIESLDIGTNTALTDLNCSYTEIKSLDISANTKLTNLYCNNTGITSLDVSNNTKLTRLSCEYNAKLAKLTVAGATELTELLCFGTGISDLDVSNNTKLTTLYCDNNAKLANLTVAGATELTSLSCYKTGISDLDVSKNTKLTILDCRHTGISDLDVSNNTKLTRLDCSDTPLAYLNIGTNNNLNIRKDNLKPVSLEITEDSFNMADKFIGIELGNVTNVSGADYKNGIMSNYDVGTPITYRYACGTSSSGAQTIDVTLNLTDTRANSTISITENLSKTYDKTAVNAMPNVSTTGSCGPVRYYWKKKVNGIWEQIASAPTDAGTYRVTASLTSDSNYKGATNTKDFVISQATNSWINDLAITDWTFGDQPNDPTAKAMFGDKINYLYSDTEKGIYTDKVPTTAGTWYVKATVASTENYTGLESIKKFEITKANDTWVEGPAILDWVFGEAPNTPTAKAKSDGTVNISYSSSEKGTYTDKVPTNAGTWYMKATVADSNNYNGLESIVSFTIAPKNADNNSQIIISDINSDKDVENLVIKDGDKELEKGTDYDVDKKQNGNEVIVSITFKGNYTGTITKTYTVNIETPKDEPKETASIPTGDNTQTGLLAMISLLSASCVAFLTGKKRKKGYNK